MAHPVLKRKNGMQMIGFMVGLLLVSGFLGSTQVQLRLVQHRKVGPATARGVLESGAGAAPDGDDLVDPLGRKIENAQHHVGWQTRKTNPYQAERTRSCNDKSADESLALAFEEVRMLVEEDYRHTGGAKMAIEHNLAAARAAPRCLTPIVNLLILDFVSASGRGGSSVVPKSEMDPIIATGAGLEDPVLKPKFILWMAIRMEDGGQAGFKDKYREAIRANSDFSMQYFGLLPEVALAKQANLRLLKDDRLSSFGLGVVREGMRTLLGCREFGEFFGGYAVITEAEARLWNEHWYIFIRNVLPPKALDAVQKVYRELIGSGSLRFKDSQSTRFVSYNDPVARFIQAQIQDLVQRVVDEPAKPTYTYFGGYIGSSILLPHTDRKQCEYTMSLNIDINPRDAYCPLSLGNKAKYMRDSDEGGHGKKPPLDQQVTVFPKPGDALLFKGRHLTHWRDLMPPNQNCSNVFLHYVKRDFALTLN